MKQQIGGVIFTLEVLDLNLLPFTTLGASVKRPYQLCLNNAHKFVSSDTSSHGY